MAGENGWKSVTIQSLIDDGVITAHKDGNYGSNYPRKHEFGDVGVPLLTAKLLNDAGGRIDFEAAPRLATEKADKLTYGFIESDDVLLSHNATVGRVAVVPELAERVLVGTSLTYFRVDPDRLLPRYLAAFFAGRDFQNQLIAVMSHSTRNQVPITAQRRLTVVVPPLSEQKAIAEILGALDAKIELNRRMNETLESLARSVFKSWFVDFDPVRAKMDGRDPPGLPPATAALFPNSFEHTPDGELIPAGWRQTRLTDEIDFQGGFAFKSRDWQDEGVPVVKIGSVKPGIIDLDQVSFVSDEIADQSSRYRLSVGDLLIGMTGYVGEVGIVPPAKVLPLLNQRVGKFVLPTPGTASLGFWYCTTRQIEFRSFVEGRSHGTAQANVSATGIMDYPLVVPTDVLMSRFNTTCAPMFDRILDNHGQMRTLAALRDTLLPRLLSGELRVPAAERLVQGTSPRNHA